VVVVALLTMRRERLDKAQAVVEMASNNQQPAHRAELLILEAVVEAVAHQMRMLMEVLAAQAWSSLESHQM
jgi:hypothetical protein